MSARRSSSAEPHHRDSAYGYPPAYDYPPRYEESPTTSTPSAGQALERARDRVEETATQAQDRTGQVASQAQDRVSRLGDQVRYQAQRAGGGFQRMLQENPGHGRRRRRSRSRRGACYSTNQTGARGDE